MKFCQSNALLSSWRKLTSGSTNRQIFGAVITVAFGTIIVKVVSVLKELAVAWKFGTGDELDAFFIALMIPFFIINVVAGSFNSALIPTYIQTIENEGREAAQRLFNGALILGLAMLVSLTVPTVIAAPFYLPYIAAGFDQEKLDLTFRLLCVISPLILLSGVTTLWSAVLNAQERFSLAALSPMVTPAITILLLLTTNWGIFALASSLLLGALFEIFLLGRAMHKQRTLALPKWYGYDKRLHQVVNQLLPMIAGSILLGSTSLVDQSMASMLLPGSVAALNYGNRVVALPNSLLHSALSTAVIPYFSKMVASHDWSAINHTLKRYMLLSFAVTVPLASILIVFSEPIVQILFQRGSFTIQDTHLVAQIQSAFAIQIPFYVGGILFVRLISSVLANHILMYGTVISLVVNISFNYLFMKIMGISGIALSTSFVYVISFLFLFFSWWRLSKKYCLR